jgi:5-methylthioadenosine/S-adenosylhomocysteine deaminase
LACIRGYDAAVPRRLLHSDRVVLQSSNGLSVAPAAVVVDRASILAVHPVDAESIPAIAASEGVDDAHIVRLGARILAPAFVDTHTHLAMSVFRGVGLSSLAGNVVEDLYYVVETRYQPGDIEAFTRLGALEVLRAGTAVVWDHYYAAHEVVAACRDVGLSAVIAPTLQDRAGPGVAQHEAQLEATVAIAEDASLAAAGIVAALGPHATDTVSADLWDAIATIASAHDLPLHLHCAQSREEYERAVQSAGTSPVGLLVDGGWLGEAPRTVLVHGQFVHAADLAGLDPARDVLGYCPASQIQYCFPASVRDWRDAGFDVVLGTDCGACNDGMNVQQELRLLAGAAQFGVPRDPAYRAFFTSKPGDRSGLDGLTEARAVRLADGLDAAAVLRSVWEVPGGLHPALPVGRIAAGCRANLLVIDPDHPAMWPATDVLRALAMQQVAPAIDRMMVNGQWVTEDREHHLLGRLPEHREMALEARRRLERLLA